MTAVSLDKEGVPKANGKVTSAKWYVDDAELGASRPGCEMSSASRPGAWP